MTSTVDLLAAIHAHLMDFELPPIASVHAAAYLSEPQVTLQLASHEPRVIAQGLLAWADTLTTITIEAWRTPDGDRIQLSVRGLLAEGTTVQVYGGLPATGHSLGADLPPGATATVTLATLRHLATPGPTTDEAAL